MCACKYIAAGFMNDANKLLNDFAKCEDNDFKTFCNVWKEHKFAHIFMGRPDYKEFREFTSEIYQLTLDYMMSSSTESQIAAIYLLYSLYKSQGVILPVKIRITQSQYQVFQQIHSHAVRKKIFTLLYILDYLKKNCLDLVANGSLYGPCCSLNKDTLMKPKADQVGILSDLKQDMTLFQESKTILNLKKMRSQYLKQKDSIMSASCNVGADKGSDIVKSYERFDFDLDVLAHGRRHAARRNLDNSSDIGNRRAMLKKSSYKRRALFRYLNPEEEPNEDTEKSEVVPIKKKRQYKKRLPVNERRVGRPRKRPVDRDSSDESEGSPPSTSKPDTVKNNKRGPTGRKKVSYLKNHEGPVILEKKTPKKELIVDDDYTSTSDDSSDIDDLEF
ncbi:snRNA-activating protein complex subunit 1-like [Parasteatoda tepidariorum]|uniref:snRNA-activating protein complex subunit 1-like n=1 Tax=Parasteatoda tepidariorum TaxID=114398 RepID=UPI00077F8754|nr:snRNA-activating protein complex subunit 1-like [Parasteatoda tepidariorum]